MCKYIINLCKALFYVKKYAIVIIIIATVALEFC